MTAGPFQKGGEVVCLDRRQLLARHLSGDQSAFQELMLLYRAPVYTYLSRSGVSDAARDDIFQEVFLRVHRFAASYDNSRALTPWIFTIVANCVRSHFRSRRVRNLFHRNLFKPFAVDPEHRLDQREILRWLAEATKQLPLKQREVLLLHCVEGMDQARVAETLDIPISTVKTLLRRARLKLARMLAARNASAKREAL